MTIFEDRATAVSRESVGLDMTTPSCAMLLSGAAALATLCWAGLALLILS